MNAGSAVLAARGHPAVLDGGDTPGDALSDYAGPFGDAYDDLDDQSLDALPLASSDPLTLSLFGDGGETVEENSSTSQTADNAAPTTKRKPRRSTAEIDAARLSGDAPPKKKKKGTA